ncbi:MAG: hypothetical protein V3S69_05605, partial [Dehalococcoidales bacterium]
MFVTEDGGEVRPLPADMLHTNNTFEAQRKAIIFLKQSRNQRVVVFQGNYSCFRIQPGSTILLDIAEYGFSGEKFFVTEWAFNADGISLTLLQEVDSVWADPLEGDYTVRSETGALTFGNTGVPPPTALAAVPILGGVEVTWTSPPANTFAAIEVWASDDNVRGNAQLVATVFGEEYIDQIVGDLTKYYWVRAVDELGRVSTFEPDLTTTTVIAAPLSDSSAPVVPNFTPGFIGGSSDFVWTLNEDLGGANDGEIKVDGDTFEHPDGTTITTTANPFAINTVYESAVVGRFYIMFSAVIAETRFGGVAADWGAGDDTRFISVTFDTVNTWRARNNSGTFFAFTPLATDCIMAVCDKLAASGGIQTIIPLTAGTVGAGGTPGGDGDDGDDALSMLFTNTAHSVPVTNLGVEDWTGSGGDFAAFEAAVSLTFADNDQHNDWSGLSNGEYNIEILFQSGDTLTVPALTGETTTIGTLADWAGNLTQVTVYRILAYIQTSTGAQVLLAKDITLTPGNQGGDGLDGTNGLPGASLITAYDDADTDGSSSSAGKYHFLRTITNTTGTLDWDLITGQSGDIVDYFSLHEDSTGGTPDNSGAFDEIEVGDVMAWWISNTKWVSFRIDSIETAPANMNKWGVSVIAFEGTGDISGSGGVNVEIRFSRAFKFVLTIGDISEIINVVVSASPNQDSAFRVNSNGVLQTQDDLGSWDNEETWIGNGANSDYECKFEITDASDALQTSAGLDVWLVCSTIRAWSVQNTASLGSEQAEGTLSFRDPVTNLIL